MKIANKYKESEDLHKKLHNARCSQPTPSSTYVLPKDHKEGSLKGRPIVAALDSPSVRLAKLFSSELSNILHHINAHIPKTSSFLDSLNSISIKLNSKLASLDVCNLYGSIPLEDSAHGLGVFSITKAFFNDFKHDLPNFNNLSNDDFESLLRLIFSYDRILLNDKFYSQKTGLSMGNPVAPQLAIIYMNYIETSILNLLPNCYFWKRYIDDIFIIYEDTTNTNILEIANSVNKNIQFTIEHPNSEGHLPFLDCSIFIFDNMLHFTLYSKPIHSGCIFNFNSHSSTHSKTNIITGELNRADRNSSNDDFKAASRNKIILKLKNNDYPSHFINKAICKYESSLNSTGSYKPNHFIRVPYINEQHKRKCINILKHIGMYKFINFSFIGSPSLKKLFRPPKEKLICNSDCYYCKHTHTPNLCTSKHVIYQINCKYCSQIYIGQTSRMIKTRLTEHFKGLSNSAVFSHFKSKHPNLVINLSWQLIHTNIPNNNKREILESIYIKRCDPKSLMNNCNGRELNYIT